MNKRLVVSMGTVVCLGALVGNGRAQDAARPQAIAEPQPKTWSLSLTAQAVYDDNRDGNATNAVSNLDLILRPRAALLYNLDQTFISLFYEPSYDWRSNPRDVASGQPQHRSEWYQSGGIDIARQLTPMVGVKVGDVVSYTDDPQITEGGVSVRENENYLGNWLYANVNVTPSRLAYVRLNGEYRLKRFQDSVVADTEDEDTFDANVTAGYALLPTLNLIGQVDYQVFKNSNTNSYDRGADVVGINGGLEEVFNPNLTGRMTAGFQHAEYEDPSQNSFNGPMGRVEAVVGSASQTRLRLLGEYGVYMPYVRPYSLQRMWTFRGSLDHDVTRDLLVTAFYQFTNSRYPAEDHGGPPLDLSGGRDKMMDLGVKADYRFNRHWSGEVGYRYQDWNSDVRESYHHDIVDVSLTATL